MKTACLGATPHKCSIRKLHVGVTIKFLIVPTVPPTHIPAAGRQWLPPLRRLAITMATPGELSVQAQTSSGSCQVDDQLQEVPAASRRERLRGGYECEIVRPPEKIQTECSICLQVLKEPQLISCCGHNFCRSCIERVKKDDKNCPLCNEADFTLMHNKGLERSLKEFEVFCTHQKNGCKWVGELSMLEQHLNADSEPEKQFEGCDFVEVKCMHECGRCFQRCFLGNHQADECPKRPFSCDYCREYESIFEDVVNHHYPVCKCYPLSCPNNCTPYAIERQHLEHHLSKDCPLQVVNCDFHYTGCEVKLPRSEMPAHLAENYTHMSLLATFNQKLVHKNDEMAKVLLEKNEEIKRLTEDLQREAGASQTAIDALRQDNEALRFRTQLLEDQVQRDNEALRQETQNQMEHATLALKEELKQDLQENIAAEVERQKTIAKESEMVRQEMFDQSEMELTAPAVRRKETYLKQDTTSQAQYQVLKGEVDQLWKDTVTVPQFLALQASVEKLYHHVHIVPVQLTMTDFEKHKRKNDRWYSEPFYTHPDGYKMCLGVYANGSGDGKGTHVTVYVHLMQGEFNNHLKWPFRGDITIQLLNQLEDEEHHSKTIHFTDRTHDHSAGRVTTGERGLGWGYATFIAHTNLVGEDDDSDDDVYDIHPTKYMYLKSDSLYFKVTKVELK